MDSKKIYANALNQSPQIGPASLKKIKEYFGSFEKGWRTPLESLKKITGNKELKEFRKEIDPEKEIQILEKAKIQILLKEEFPSLLLETPVPPEILYIKGSLPSESQIHLAVVGTRKLSSYGKDACEKIVSGLKDYGLVIISGLALGIDTVAHKTALANKLKTVAVLGSGLESGVIYPRANCRLAEQIVENGGCLVSEYSFAMKAATFAFPQRNRIVAGLCSGTLVIEAPERSGALITAFMALEYNREVFAVPGSIFSINSKGANNLLKLGAFPVTASDDILRSFGIEPEERQKQTELSPLEIKIVSFLYESLSRDELIRKTGMPAKEINPLLIQMEIKGIIKESGGLLYKL